jgi:hypothetical protein
LIQGPVDEGKRQTNRLLLPAARERERGTPKTAAAGVR